MKTPKRNHSIKILMAIAFYPRGGSAQVVRYLSRALISLGHQVHLLTGSLHNENPEHDARVFYRELPLTEVDYTEAGLGFKQGLDPISARWSVPFHPSYEDKPEVPDRVFYKVKPEECDALVSCWQRQFERLRQRFQPEVVHFHHLNHIHLAGEVLRTAAKVTQIHGTEIKMLERMLTLDNQAGARDELVGFWRDRIIRAAALMDHCVVNSADVHERAKAQLSLTDEQLTIIPNGVDLSLFKAQHWTDDRKLSFLRQILVEEPRGWDESGVPGSIRYTEADLDRFKSATGKMKPLVMFVGRFLNMKRVPLLVKAVAKVNEKFQSQGNPLPFNLLIWGGMPGEWEGEHPYTTTRQLGLSNVFFSGWLPHSALSQGLNLAEVFVAPSYFEPFGQVYLEAMATGLPVIATRSGGPLSFVVDSGSQANGWFCETDDVDSLAQTLYAAITNENERRRRGANAVSLIRKKYNWASIAEEYVRIYERTIANYDIAP